MTSPPWTLLCDHRGGGLEALVRLLSARGHRIERSPNLRRSLERLAEERPSLVVLDPLSPAGTVELEAIDRARRGGEEVQPVPLLVVADPGAAAESLLAARSLEGGPWDLLWRDAAPSEVELRLERLEAVGELLGEMDALRHRAAHDDKTDLLRGRSFEARLAEHFSAAQRHELSLALVLIDLDRFGQVNKLFDHTVGDALIARVGEVVRRALRREDVAGRLGGDEFAVLLPYTRKMDAARVVGRLREEIKRLSGPLPGTDRPVEVSASIGFETFDGRDVESVEALRRHAERAMRAAKLGGGDRAVYYRSLPEAAGRGEEGSG